MIRVTAGRFARSLLLGLGILLLPTPALCGGKVGIYGLHMVPQNEAASRYSDDAWGGGIHVVVPVPRVMNLLAGTFGFEVANFLSETTTYTDPHTLLRVDQNTTQNLFRVYLGAEFGSHSRGFLRPHAGMNIALAHYEISGTLTIPDDFDPDRSITQDLGSNGSTRFGSDITLGVDLNFSDTVSIDGGVRYVKNFSVPQQLGEGSVTLYPDYLQYYAGIGLSFNFLRHID